MNSCGENSGDNVRRSGSFHHHESIINHILHVEGPYVVLLMYSNYSKRFWDFVLALLKDHNYPHVCLYVGYFCSTNSTFVVFDTSMLFPIMLEQFCQGEEFEMAIRTFVAPLVAASIEWRGLEAVAQFVPFHPPRL